MRKIAIIILLLPYKIFAEVSDKMASQSELWLFALIFSISLGFLLRWSKWINIVALPFTILFYYYAYDTIAQPDIGPAIIQEQGKIYIFALYGSASLVFLGVCIGNILNLFKNNCRDQR